MILREHIAVFARAGCENVVHHGGERWFGHQSGMSTEDEAEVLQATDRTASLPVLWMSSKASEKHL